MVDKIRQSLFLSSFNSPELTEVDREESRKKNMIMVEKRCNLTNFD